MSAASRSVQAAPRTGRLGLALAAILVAAVVVTLLVLARPTVSSPQAAPAAGPAQTLHDRGWATAGDEDTAAAPILHDRGLSTVASEAASGPKIFYVGFPYVAPDPVRDNDDPSGAGRHR
jgi:hypothetical protein